jgi:superfamily II DNA or RNA helicase
LPISIDQLITLSDYATIRKGMAYYHEQRVELYRQEAGDVFALVRGKRPQPYEVEVRFKDDARREVERATCTCKNFSSRDGMCKHVIATVLTVQAKASAAGSDEAADRVKGQHGGTNFKLKRQTDRAAAQMLKSRANQLTRQALLLDTPKAVLVPTLHLLPTGPALTFKVGAGRHYVIQNLYDFKVNFLQSETMVFGTQYLLWMNPAAFAPESQPLLDFFLRFYNEYDHVDNLYSAAERKSMALNQRMLEAFFALSVGQSISWESPWFNGPVEVLDDNYAACLALSPQGEGFVLTSARDYHFISGARRCYILEGDRLYCCAEDYSAAGGALLETLADSDWELYFAAADVSGLLVALQAAESHLRLELDPELAPYNPPPLVTRVYFDADSAGVSARMTFTYGNRTHEAFAEKKLERSLDIAGEIRAEEQLKHYLGEDLSAPGTLRLVDDEEKLYHLIAHGVAAIADWAEVYAATEFDRIKVRPPVTMGVGVRVDGGLLEVDFDLGNLDFAELAAILASYRRAKKYHRLRDGSFLALEDDGLRQLSALADGLDITEKALAAGHASLSLNQALYLDALMKNHAALRYERDRAFKNIVRSMSDVADADFVVPPHLRRVLRNYQKVGYRWLRTLDFLNFGGILADDMGLGKTLQVLALLQAYREENPSPAPSVVVCPASLVLNWASEAARFTPELKTAALTGPASERAAMIAAAGEVDLLITSYDQLKRDIERYLNLDFAYIVLDEAQFIKNQNTLSAKSVKCLRGHTRLALTGTPIENTLAELWSIFDYLMPGYLKSYHHFRVKYESRIVKQGDNQAAEQLRALVQPFILRRLKQDVLQELPEKTESNLLVSLGETQQKIYISALAQAREELADKLAAAAPGQGRIVVLAALTRMRQICCDPALVYADYKGGSAKLDAALELIESCIQSGHRILLFSQFTSMLRLIEARLQTHKIDYYTLEGSTPPSERLTLVNAFNHGGTPVFLISLKAGGTGLNLTGADVVIHFDPWWNISAQNQATDRAHRIGQTNPVQVFKMIAQGTVEERILQLQEKKAALAEAVIREGGNAFETLSGEDLLALFAER